MSNEQSSLSIEIQAANLVSLARDLGLNVTIEHSPLRPLAMGNYAAVIRVWPAKSADGTTAVRVMPPRHAGLYDPRDPATIEMDRAAYALINSTPILQSLLYDINLLPECIAKGDNVRWAYMHSIVSHFRLMISPAAPDIEKTDPVFQANAKRYSAWCDNQGIHSNRFPAWSEMSEADRAAWLAENTVGGGNAG